MTPMISLSAAAGLAAEPAPAQPSDAQVPLHGLAELVFKPLEPQPAHLPEALAPAPLTEPLPLPDEAVIDPQQWLNAMLDQQAVQLQARGSTDARPDMPAPMPAAERLLSRLPMQPPVMVPGQEGLAAQQVPADKLWHVAQEVTAQPAEGKPAALSGVLSDLHSVPKAVAAVLADTPQAAQEPVLERGLKLAAPQARWGEQMLHALRETVQVQVQQRFQQATIRLDPPELGSLEIFITQEPGRLSVQISAAQGDVARLLQHTSDRLRQELVEQNTLQINVQISGGSEGHAGRDSSRQRHEPGIAEAIQDAPGASPLEKHRASDVLVTV